jgi:D-serine deaminase-like pyridoxal phosphate-dependent protein
MQEIHRISDADNIDSPALLVFPDIVRKNIAAAIQLVGDPARLRPHVKTHKSSDVVALMMQAGIQQFKCASIAEAEMLARAGAEDVLFAFPLHGPKISRLLQLTKAYPETRFSCLIDHARSAEAISLALEAMGLTLGIYLDLNTGMNRTGIEPGETALELYAQISANPRFRVKGLHAYDGHIRHSDLQERKRACDEAFAKVLRLKESALGRGLAVDELIAGGSPSFPVHAQYPDRICSPGTFVYWDQGYASLFPDQPFVYAAILITRFVSNPSPGIWCLDLGHKSVAAESPLDKRVYFPDLPGWTFISQSEEHLVLKAPEGKEESVKQGDVVYGIPWHICPTVALYERMICIEEGKSAGEWMNVARDRKISF